jgi:hypothetical protein
MNYIKIIEELNAELYDRFGEEEFGFEYSTNGYIDTISFNSVPLWNSELDDREWMEEKNEHEPFEPYIRKVFNNYIDKMYLLKL